MELSIEEKAKRYDEAIERAKSKIKNDKDHVLYENDIIELFPELKESEDERIRKELIKFVKVNIPNEERYIAWLEKQGEKNKWKPSKDEMDALYGLSYIANKMDDKKDEAITKLYQDLKREFFDGASYENMFPSSLVDAPIKDGKQGEQKSLDDIVKEVTKDKDAAISFFKSAGIINENGELADEYKIEQGEQNYQEEVDNLHNYLYGEQKSAWSEVDEENLNWFEKFFRAESVFVEGKDIPQDRYLWFKNLKDRVQPKHEWSEKDESMRTRCIGILGKCYMGELPTKLEEELNWLKSLRPQNRWKPSDEQMKAIEHICDGNYNVDLDILDSIYRDFKKLKG